MASDKCRLCANKTLAFETERAMECCSSCAKVAGVRPMPPSSRPRTGCGRCSAHQLVRAVPLTHQAPMYVTTPGDMVRKALGEPSRMAYGLIEMYVCRSCGYIEWYCVDPESIPVSPLTMTQLMETDSQGPYR